MPQKKSSPSTSRLRLLSSFLSAGLYSTWVMFHVRDAVLQAIVASGLAQFALSFGSTYVFSSLIARLVRTSSSLFNAGIAATIAAAIYAVVLFSVHYAIRTPHIVSTLLPVIAVATTYAFAFASYQALQNARLAVADD